MEVTPGITIAKHSVATRKEDGLSPLQYQLLSDPRRIRIVDAPTGAGKSYAFQKAMLNEQRILFIVPTRRLAQNISAGLINDLVEIEGWSQELAEKKVAILSSDQTQVLREKGVQRISGYRLRQLEALDETRDDGEMIVAVPEVISNLLHREYLNKGNAGDGAFNMLTHFDHIVFDEFHTIDAQGFGLAALFAKLASVRIEESGQQFGNAKVSFLSATPLKILPTLEQLGIGAEQVAELQETLVDEEGSRPLHGDVTLSLDALASLPECLIQQMALIQGEVSSNRQVVIIYNALSDLRRDLPVLRQQFQQADIALEKVLVINSIDDSGDNRQTSYGFHSGRQQNPDNFNILIATASVEMGVTFREANVMFMEPGFAPMNFLQRFGRAARRGCDGQVFVRVDQSLSDRMPWLRDLQSWVKAHQGQQVNVLEFNRRLSQSTRDQFDTEKSPPLSGEPETPHFGSLSHYANYASGLYWQQLIRNASNRGYRAEHLRQHQPKSSAHVYKLLQAFQSLLDDPDYKRPAERWLQWFMQRALMLRDIGTRVTIREGDGFIIQADKVWLARETSVLNLPMQQDHQGNDYFQLEGELDDYLLPANEKNRVYRHLRVYYPHKMAIGELKDDASLVKHWLKDLEDTRRCMDTEEAWEDHPEAMKAVSTLVRLSGCVAGHDTDISANIISSVL